MCISYMSLKKIKFECNKRCAALNGLVYTITYIFNKKENWHYKNICKPDTTFSDKCTQKFKVSFLYAALVIDYMELYVYLWMNEAKICQVKSKPLPTFKDTNPKTLL